MVSVNQKVVSLDFRREALAHWVTAQLQGEIKPASAVPDPIPLSVVSGDASFRRYFRANLNGQTWIAVDAPPDKEDSHPFVAIAHGWYEQGVNVPKVHAADFEMGFMLLSDFGDRLLLPELNENSVDDLYGRAFDELLKIQQCRPLPEYVLPPYNRDKLNTEMQLCPDWFFTQLLALGLSTQERRMLETVFQTLIDSALAQTQVNVHRDYHSRNLMLADNGSIGVLDFQDAVTGPVSYDLVSLLRDCYISWPETHLQRWVEQYASMARNKGLINAQEQQLFRQAFDLMGMQRHIKCVGIFSRLYLRDDKPSYLKDIPRTFAYIQQVCRQYLVFEEFGQWLDEKVVPAMNASDLFGKTDIPVSSESCR